MKGSGDFKTAINNHLQERAAGDALFAETLKKPNKSLDECITYILNTVQKSGCNGFDDAEIFNMAAHYYDEDDIKPGTAASNARVVINHHVAKSSTGTGSASPKKEAKKKPEAKPAGVQQSYLF